MLGVHPIVHSAFRIPHSPLPTPHWQLSYF
jgi:hypothetical protein